MTTHMSTPRLLFLVIMHQLLYALQSVQQMYINDKTSMVRTEMLKDIGEEALTMLLNNVQLINNHLKTIEKVPTTALESSFICEIQEALAALEVARILKVGHLRPKVLSKHMILTCQMMIRDLDHQVAGYFSDFGWVSPEETLLYIQKAVFASQTVSQ